MKINQGINLQRELVNKVHCISTTLKDIKVDNENSISEFQGLFDHQNYELPDLNIYTKPINDQEQKYINLDYSRILNEDLKQIQDYSNNKNPRYSLTNSLAKNNRERRNQTVKKSSFKETTILSDEIIDFSSLLRDPIKIDLIINTLTSLKTDIIMHSVSKIK